MPPVPSRSLGFSLCDAAVEELGRPRSPLLRAMAHDRASRPPAEPRLVPVLTRSLAGKLGSEPDELLPSRSLTPLHLCAALDTSPHDWLKLGFRGDYTKGDSIHCTPLELAVYRRSELAIRLMLGQLDVSQQRLQASRLLIRASEILDVSGMQLLLGLGADASAKDERQLSALEVFIQRGAPRKLQVSFKVPLVSDVDFCRMVDQLIQNGASTLRYCGDCGERDGCRSDGLVHAPYAGACAVDVLACKLAAGTGSSTRDRCNRKLLQRRSARAGRVPL